MDFCSTGTFAIGEEGCEGKEVKRGVEPSSHERRGSSAYTLYEWERMSKEILE
jgi:hypothetical protein